MMFRRLRYQIATSAAIGAMCVLAGGYAVPSEIGARTKDDRTLAIPSDRFVAAKAFAVGRRIGDHVIVAVGLNFEKYFFSLVETDAVGAPLDPWTLGQSTDDATLIAMIGGEDKIVLSLPAIYRLIALGHRGDNHADGQSNFAYARSPVDGRLWAIHWSMNAAGEWTIGAVFVPHPDLDWSAGSRLFAPRIGGEEPRPQQCAARSRLTCIARP